MNNLQLLLNVTESVGDLLELLIDKDDFDSATLDSLEKEGYDDMIQAIQRLTGLLPTKDLEA